MHKHRILMISKDLTSQGGVVNVVSMLMKNFSNSIESQHFKIGSKEERKGKLLNFGYPILDCLRLVKCTIKNFFDSVCLNSALDAKVLLRDGLFLLALEFIGFKNTILFIHGWDISLARRIKNSQIYNFIFTFILRKATIIIVLSSKFKKCLQQIGITNEKIHIMTTMFDADTFLNYKFVEDNRNPKTLIFLSRFDHSKGGIETVQAFYLLSNRYPKLRLIMAGDGPELKNLKDLVAELGIEDRVCFTGYVRGAEKVRVFGESDIYVFPTYYREGCPVALLEAMAAGLAVVTTRVGAIPDIIRSGENGVLLKDTNPENIAIEIEKLISDPIHLKKMRNLNHQQAFEKYEASKVTKKFEGILKTHFSDP